MKRNIYVRLNTKVSKDTKSLASLEDFGVCHIIPLKFDAGNPWRRASTGRGESKSTCFHTTSSSTQEEEGTPLLQRKVSQSEHIST